MYYALYRRFPAYIWRFIATRSAQPAASDRLPQGGDTPARARARQRTPSTPHLRA